MRMKSINVYKETRVSTSNQRNHYVSSEGLDKLRNLHVVASKQHSSFGLMCVEQVESLNLHAGHFHLVITIRSAASHATQIHLNGAALHLTIGDVRLLKFDRTTSACMDWCIRCPGDIGCCCFGIWEHHLRKEEDFTQLFTILTIQALILTI